MDELYKSISSLTKEESRNLTILLNRTNSNKDRKDLLLLNYIKNNIDDIDEGYINDNLYGSNNKNTFYRLKNRLLTDLNKSLLFLHYNKTNYNKTLNLIALAKIYESKREVSQAFTFLRKAESIAIKNEFFDLADLIYANFLVLTQQSTKYNPDVYIAKRKKNKKKLIVVQEIDDLLASLTYKVRVSQNLSESDTQITSLLQKTINEHINNQEVKESLHLRFKIYSSISRILLQKNDFIALEEYLSTTYQDFIKEKAFNESNHETKLQMLTFLVNSLFKNGKIKESLKVTQELYMAMNEYNKRLFEQYLFYYYNSLVINYQVTDKQKAIDVLLEAKTKQAIQKHPMFIVFIYLNLAVLSFDLKNFKSAHKNIAKLKRESSYNNLDEGFRLKINIFELQTFFELQDIDLFDYQLNIINKDFKQLLEQKGYKRENEFISAIVQLEKNNLSNAKQFLIDYAGVENVNDIINLNNWLEEKVKK